MQWTIAIGVDTHKDAHVAVACDRVGAQLDSCSIAADSAGYVRLLRWAQELGEPAFAVEGGGSYGAGLVRLLQASGLPVFEVERPRRRERRRGKSDLIDALLERRGALSARTAALNQLQAAIVTAPAKLRERLAGRDPVAACLQLRSSAREQRVLVGVLGRLARRIKQLDAELATLERELQALTAELVPELRAECGVGPFCAAQLVVSSGDPQRMRSEASFAALGGTSPVDASSGRQQRHRLNRGGDRQLNRALHVIALNRTLHHPQTAAYYQRLLASGKTSREARRCVKRALARHFYQLLKGNPRLALTP
jgi:transposase